MTVIAIIVGTLETVSKGLEKRLMELKIRERIKIIQTAGLLRSTRILRRRPEDLRRFAVIHSSAKPLADAGVKNLQTVK